MIVVSCTHESKKKHGKDHKGQQRYKCLVCGKTWIDRSARPLGEMRISMKQAATALGLLLEGMSIRAVMRLTGMDGGTICNLILVVGENCQRLLDAKVKGVEVHDIQVDELWSFIGLKEKNRVARNRPATLGDSWTFIGVERTTKLVLAHHVGNRSEETCWQFLLKLKSAIGSGKFQITTDGFRPYTTNVPFAFGMQAHFAQLIKVYGSSQEVTRYSPAKMISAEKLPIMGAPEEDRISTSHVERLNLTVRMNNRRFTRLTNAHSKSPAHHVAMQAIFFAFYNFCRKHETLGGKTPAMASQLSDHVWTIKEVLQQAGESLN